MTRPIRSSALVRGEVIALALAAVMIVVQIASGVDYPTVPPGLIITVLTAVLVATVAGLIVDVVGIAVPVFIVIGGFVSSTGRDSLSDPSDAGAFIATVVQLVALVVAAALAVLHRVRDRGATGRRDGSNHLI